MSRSVRIETIDFKQLEQLILVALYDRYLNSNVPYTSIETLGHIVGRSGLNPIRDVLFELDQADFIQQGTKRVRVPSSPFASLGLAQFEQPKYVDEPAEIYRLTKKGALQVASFDQKLVDQLSHQLSLEDDQVPAQDPRNRKNGEDDKWEPLKLDRAAPEFVQAVQATEKAIERIEGDNGYASAEPEERNGIVAGMKGALNSLRYGLTSRHLILAGLISPLRFIVEKFSGAGIGEAAKHAINALLKLLF